MATKAIPGDEWYVTGPVEATHLRPCKVNYQPGYRFHCWCEGEHGPAALVEDDRGQVMKAEPASSIQFTDRGE